MTVIFRRSSFTHINMTQWLHFCGHNTSFGLCSINTDAFLEICSTCYFFLSKTRRFGQSWGRKILKSREETKTINNTSNIVVFKFRGVILVPSYSAWVIFPPKATTSSSWGALFTTAIYSARNYVTCMGRRKLILSWRCFYPRVGGGGGTAIW